MKNHIKHTTNALIGLVLLDLSACSAPPKISTTPQTNAQAPISHFKAYGFSPAWQAEINGSTLSYSVPETANINNHLRRITVRRLAYAKGVNYDGNDAGVAITLDIRTGNCNTANISNTHKNSNPNQFIASLHYGDKKYTGCANAVS